MTAHGYACARCHTVVASVEAVYFCRGPCHAVAYCSAACEHTTHDAAACAQLAEIMAKLLPLHEDMAAPAAAAHGSAARVLPAGGGNDDDNDDDDSDNDDDDEQQEEGGVRKVATPAVAVAHPAIYVLHNDAASAIAQKLTPHEARKAARAFYGTPLFGVFVDPVLWQMYYARDFGLYNPLRMKRLGFGPGDYWETYNLWEEGSLHRWGQDHWMEFEALARRSARGQLPQTAPSIATGRAWTRVHQLAASGTVAVFSHAVKHAYSVTETTIYGETVFRVAVIYGMSPRIADICAVATMPTEFFLVGRELFRATGWPARGLAVDWTHDEWRIVVWLATHPKMAIGLHIAGCHLSHLIAEYWAQHFDGINQLQKACNSQKTPLDVTAAFEGFTVALRIAERWHETLGALGVLEGLVARANFDVNQRAQWTRGGIARQCTLVVLLASRWHNVPNALQLLERLVDQPDFVDVQLWEPARNRADSLLPFSSDVYATVGYLVARDWAETTGSERLMEKLIRRPEFRFDNRNWQDDVNGQDPTRRRRVIDQIVDRWHANAAGGVRILQMLLEHKDFDPSVKIGSHWISAGIAEEWSAVPGVAPLLLNLLQRPDFAVDDGQFDKYDEDGEIIAIRQGEGFQVLVMLAARWLNRRADALPLFEVALQRVSPRYLRKMDIMYVEEHLYTGDNALMLNSEQDGDDDYEDQVNTFYSIDRFIEMRVPLPTGDFPDQRDEALRLTLKRLGGRRPKFGYVDNREMRSRPQRTQNRPDYKD